MSVDYKVRQIYNVVIKEVTETQESWKSVLRLAGQIYRYEFDNVLMVYAQKPHATLVADFDTWKKVGRYVKRGSSEARELLKKTYGNDDYDCRDIMVLLRRP